MIIKNGFVRDEDGYWNNLSLFSRFCVNDLYDERQLMDGFDIVGYFKEDVECEDPQTMSDRYDTFDEALCALDDAFGYTA